MYDVPHPPIICMKSLGDFGAQGKDLTQELSQIATFSSFEIQMGGGMTPLQGLWLKDENVHCITTFSQWVFGYVYGVGLQWDVCVIICEFLSQNDSFSWKHDQSPFILYSSTWTASQ